MENNKNNELLKEAIELIKETYNNLSIYDFDKPEEWIDRVYEAESIIRRYAGDDTNEENDLL